MTYYSRYEQTPITQLLGRATHVRNSIIDCQRRGSTAWVPAEFAPIIRSAMQEFMYEATIGRRGRYRMFDFASSPSFYKSRKDMNKRVGARLTEIMADPNLRESQKVECILDLINDSDDEFNEVRDWVSFLNERFTFAIRECVDCEHVDHQEHGCSTYGRSSRWVCESCLSENYTFSDRRDEYISNEDYEEEMCEDDEDDEDDDGGLIGSYHSSKKFLRHIPSSADNRNPQVYVGMELEVEVRDTHSINSVAQELIDDVEKYSAPDGKKHTYMALESDGSLDRGFEMVTGWTGLDVHRKQLEFFKQPWHGVRSHDTRTCGLHVHISKADMTLFHGAKLSLFIHDSNNQKLVKDIARRTGASYAKVLNKKADYAWLHNAKRSSDNVKFQLTRLNADRYEALNFHNEETVEFRMFKGTLRYETQIACLEFAYMSWFFTRDTGINSLTTENFINFICETNNRRDSKYLRRYLKDKGYVLPKSAVTRDNPRTDSVSQPIETATSTNV